MEVKLLKFASSSLVARLAFRPRATANSLARVLKCRLEHNSGIGGVTFRIRVNLFGGQTGVPASSNVKQLCAGLELPSGAQFNQKIIHLSTFKCVGKTSQIRVNLLGGQTGVPASSNGEQPCAGLELPSGAQYEFNKWKRNFLDSRQPGGGQTGVLASSNGE